MYHHKWFYIQSFCIRKLWITMKWQKNLVLELVTMSWFITWSLATEWCKLAFLRSTLVSTIFSQFSLFLAKKTKFITFYITFYVKSAKFCHPNLPLCYCPVHKQYKIGFVFSRFRKISSQAKGSRNRSFFEKCFYYQ